MRIVWKREAISNRSNNRRDNRIAMGTIINNNIKDKEGHRIIKHMTIIGVGLDKSKMIIKRSNDKNIWLYRKMKLLTVDVKGDKMFYIIGCISMYLFIFNDKIIFIFFIINLSNKNVY